MTLNDQAGNPEMPVTRSVGTEARPVNSRELPVVWMGLWLPAILMLLGTATYSLPTEGMFMVCAVAGSCLCVAITSVFLFRSQSIRFTWVIGDALLLGYVLGTLNTAIQISAQHASLAEYFHRAQAELSTALALILWVAAVLFILGATAETPITIPQTPLMFRHLRFICLGLTLVLGAMLTGGIGYMGVQASDTHHVSPLGALAGVIAPALPGLTAYLLAGQRQRRMVALLCMFLAVEFAALLPQGRRALIYSLAISVVGFTLRRARIRLPLWSKVLFVVLAIGLVAVSNLVFYALRFMTYDGTGSVSLSELAPQASDFLLSGRSADFDEQLSENLRERTFILLYFSDLVAALPTHTPLHGEDALYCIKTAIPSSLYPQKDSVLDIGMEETLANPQFGLPIYDEANSLVTMGVSDFGILGVFAYPCLMALLMSAVARIASTSLPMDGKVLVVCALVQIAIQAETSGTVWFEAFRDIGIVSVLIRSYTLLPRLLVSRASSFAAYQRCPASVMSVR